MNEQHPTDPTRETAADVDGHVIKAGHEPATDAAAAGDDADGDVAGHGSRFHPRGEELAAAGDEATDDVEGQSISVRHEPATDAAAAAGDDGDDVAGHIKRSGAPSRAAGR